MDTNSVERQERGADTRRRHTREHKRRVVEESLVEGTSVSVVARRHDVNANQLFKWRKLYREGLLEPASGSGADLVPVHMAESAVAPGGAYRSARMSPPGGEVEITLSGGHRVVVRGAGDCQALRVALEVLGR